MSARRILLICGGAEPGGDGVGDYCRGLAAQLAEMGVASLVLAINDRAIAAPSESTDPIQGVTTIRLPERLSLAVRRERAAELIAAWRPDWTSLQFVSYAFDRRGLPLRELRWLPSLLRECRLHVMLHELWIGVAGASGLRQTAMRTLQKTLILALLRRLRPMVLHTNCPYYRTTLGRHRLPAEVLPLFGNIPVTAEPAGPWLAEAIRRGGGPDLTRERNKYRLFGHFGGIAGDWPALPALTRLGAAARAAGRRAVLVSAGNAGPGAEERFAAWRREIGELDFALIGPRPPPEISQFFNAVDFGLTSHPYHLLGKSGSVAAMLEHGLPVIASWGETVAEAPLAEPELMPLIWRCDDDLEQRLAAPPERVRRPEHRGAIARSLVARLDLAARGGRSA